MIFKIIGVVLVIVSTTLMSLMFIKREKYHIEDLNDMKKALTIFKGDISFVSMPLAETFNSISTKTKGNIGKFFKKVSERLEERTGENAADIWEDVLYEFSGLLYFDDEDLEAFYSFGKILGYMDANQQMNNIDIALYYIKQKEDSLREKGIKNAKLYKSVGILSGLLIAVILF